MDVNCLKVYLYQYLDPTQITMGHYLVLLLMQIAILETPGCLGDTGSFPSLELENLKGVVDLEARSGKAMIAALVHLMIICIYNIILYKFL